MGQTLLFENTSENTSEKVNTTENALVLQIKQSQLEPETEKSLQEHFLPFYEQALEWKNKAESLVVTDVTQTEKMVQAHEARLILKNIRVSVEKTRKMLKEDSKKKGEAIDGVARVLKELIEPIEEHLEKQEKFTQIQEQKRLEALKAEREEKLKTFEVDTTFYDLVNMPQETFDQLFESSKLSYNNKIELQKKAEQDKLEKERIDNLTEERKNLLLNYWSYLTSEEVLMKFGEMEAGVFDIFLSRVKKQKDDFDNEQERIKIENERLKKEVKERQEKLDEEKRIADEKAAKLKEITDKRCKQLSDLDMKFNGQEYIYEDVNVHWTEISTFNDLEWTGLLSKIQPVIEQSKKVKAEATEKETKRLQQEAADKAKKDAELKAQKEAEEKAESARKEQLKAEKKEKLRPDKAKLLIFANTLFFLQKPELKSPESNKILDDAIKKISIVVQYIKEKAEEL